MLKLTKARIFRADNRSCFSHAGSTLLSTLTGGSDEPGAMSFFQEVYLEAGQQMEFHATGKRCVFLLPLSGGLISRKQGTETPVASEQSLLFTAGAGDTYNISNPDAENPACFLHVGFFDNRLVPANLNNVHTIGFRKMNELVPAGILADFIPGGQLYTGVFSGRAEGCYIPKTGSGNVFVFVVNGAFEMAGMLLEKGDGLHIAMPEPLEFEALSEHAVLLFTETVDFTVTR